MKNRKLWVSILAGFLAAVMLLGLVVSVLPRNAKAASSSELKDQLDALEQEKDVISDKLAELEKQQSGNMSDMESIINQKSIIDQQVSLLYAQVYNVNDQIAAYSLLIADKQVELEEAEARLAELNEKNKERIRAMEEAGRLSYWSVIFKANSFTDLLDRLNMIQEIAAADRIRLEEMSKVAQEVAKSQEELAADKADLEKTKAELEQTKIELDAKSAKADKLLLDLVEVAEDLEALHNKFEKEEEDFLDEIAKKENEYNTQLQKEEEESRQASIKASIEASIQESIQESIEESIRNEATTRPTQGSGGIGGTAGPSNNPSNVRWLQPTHYSRVSSPFGYRWHPTTGEWSMHRGVDLPAPEGTPIFASRSGYVTSALYHKTGGNTVTLNHQDGYSSVYMHMTHYIVSAGDYVKAGQVIGYVGSTGRSTGPHLHFGISYMGTYVNPMDYI